MKGRKLTNSELGMMYGVIVGSEFGIILFVVTQNPFWFTAAGVGVGLGFGIGATKDREDI